MVQEYLGAVKLFAGNFAPRGYTFCQGQTLAINQNAALFALLGTTYGGNGVTTFQLPNLQSRVPIGQGNGPGLTPRVIGETGGVETVQLLQSNLPSHAHTLNAATNQTTTNAAGPSVVTGSLKPADLRFYTAPGEVGFTPVSMNAGVVNTQGGNQQHNNIQTSMGITYIMALQGVFPSRN